MNQQIFSDITRYIFGRLEGLPAEEKAGLLEDLLVHLEELAEKAFADIDESDWEE